MKALVLLLSLLLCSCSSSLPVVDGVAATRVVTVAFVVGSGGVPSDLRIVKFVGPEEDRREFETASLEAVGKWRFKPEQVGQRQEVPIAFTVAKEPAKKANQPPEPSRL